MNETAPTVAPLRHRRWVWLEDVYSGAVDPETLLLPYTQPWYPEDIRELLDTARSRPGVPLVVSVHSSYGPASSARARKIDDPRWKAAEGFVYKARTLGRFGDPIRRAAVLVTYTGDEPQ